MIWIIKLTVHRRWYHSLIVWTMWAVSICINFNAKTLTIREWAWYLICNSFRYFFASDLSSLSAYASICLIFIDLRLSSLHADIWGVSGRHHGPSPIWRSPPVLTGHVATSSPLLLLPEVHNESIIYFSDFVRELQSLRHRTKDPGWIVVSWEIFLRDVTCRTWGAMRS